MRPAARRGVSHPGKNVRRVTLGVCSVLDKIQYLDTFCHYLVQFLKWNFGQITLKMYLDIVFCSLYLDTACG